MVVTVHGFAPLLDQTIQTSARAPHEARRAVETLAGELDLGPRRLSVFRDVQLLVSELVTNSVRHSGCAAGEGIRLRGWLRETSVRIEVSDGGFGFEPPADHPVDDRDSGRGLLILDSLADRWGVSRDGETRVWFEIGLPAGSVDARTA